MFGVKARCVGRENDSGRAPLNKGRVDLGRLKLNGFLVKFSPSARPSGGTRIGSGRVALMLVMVVLGSELIERSMALFVMNMGIPTVLVVDSDGGGASSLSLATSASRVQGKVIGNVPGGARSK